MDRERRTRTPAGGIRKYRNVYRERRSRIIREMKTGVQGDKEIDWLDRGTAQQISKKKVRSAMKWMKMLFVYKPVEP